MFIQCLSEFNGRAFHNKASPWFVFLPKPEVGSGFLHLCPDFQMKDLSYFIHGQDLCLQLFYPPPHTRIHKMSSLLLECTSKNC